MINFDDYSVDISSELFDFDLDDIKLNPSLLDNNDDSDSEAAELYGY